MYAWTQLTLARLNWQVIRPKSLQAPIHDWKEFEAESSSPS